MKKLVVIAAFLAAAFGASAQFNLGVKGGLNLSNITALEMNTKAGFHLGVMGQYMFTDAFGLESGLYYSMLGAKEKEVQTISGVDVDVKFSANPSYLQLPIMAVYKFELGRDFYLYPSAGIYLGYGIAGKNKIKAEAEGVKIEEKSDFFDEGVNSFDMGLTVGLNLQYNKLLFGLGYDYGFTKLNEYSYVGQDDLHNSNFKISVGYFFLSND